MIANKMDIEALKEVGGGWTIRNDDNTLWVLDDKTAEYLDGPFYCVPDAQARAIELGQTPYGITPAILKHIRDKNK